MEYNHRITLKNGRKCILRHAVETDAAAVLEHMKLSFSQTDYLLRYPDEMHMSEAQEADFLKSYAISADSLMLCAELDGKIIAVAGLNPVGRMDKLRHRADLGISVQKDFWNLGIGRAMLEDIIYAAGKTGYTQLELEAVLENNRAIALYEKLGFVIYGKNERAFRLRDGRYMSALLMRLEL